MTMPHLMNCLHSEDGWCLTCVREQWEELSAANERADRAESESKRWRDVNSSFESENIDLEAQAAAMREALKTAKLRIIYVGMPQEKRDENGKPCWKDALEAIDAALAHDAGKQYAERLRKAELAANSCHEVNCKVPCAEGTRMDRLLLILQSQRALEDGDYKTAEEILGELRSALESKKGARHGT